MAATRESQHAGSLPESVYRKLVEVARDIILVLDGRGSIRFVNEAVTRVLDYKPADVTGRSVEDFYHPEDLQKARDSLRKTLARGAGEQVEVYRVRRRDGSYRYLETLANNRIEDPDIGGVLLIARDVTDRLRAESERAHIQARRRLAARVGRLGIWEWNSRTDELVTNDAVRDLVRTEPGQRWSGAGDFMKRLMPEDREPATRALRGAAAGESVEGLVVRMPLPDGSLRWLYVHVQNMEPAGAPSEWVLGLVMDVTEKQRAQQEFARREELLELATWGADVGVWTWLPDEDRAEYNARCGELLGISTDKLECTTEDLYQPIHPDDLPELKRLEAELLAGRTDTFNYAYRVRDDTAGWRWVMDRGRVSERDARGRVIRVSGVTLDIDEVKRRERELDEQRLRLELALDASKLGLWDFDVVREEVFVDERYAGIVGLSADVLRHDPDEFVRHVHEDDRPRLLAAGNECLEGRTRTLYFEGRLLRPDGRMIRIRVQGFAASYRANGRAARIVGTIADISDQLREEQLRRAGELVAGIGSYEFEVGSDHAYWSEGLYQIFGRQTGLPMERETARQRLFAASGLPTASEAVRGAEQEGTEFDIEVPALNAGHKPIWVRVIGRVESFQGKPKRVYGVVQDITERRALEAELLEVANRERQKLGSDLHDGLGQELTGISLLLQGLGQQVEAANPALARPFDHVSSLLSKAIRDTRTLAHGLAPVSFGRGGLQSALQILAEQASATYAVPVELELATRQDLGLGEVAGDHIYRIVQEALSNAIRHGRADRIAIKLGASDRDCVVEVVDNGRGIDEDAAQRGGLGLRSMTYRARSIDGTFSIKKLPEGGTRVRLVCPLAPGVDDTAQPAGTAGGSSSSDSARSKAR